MLALMSTNFVTYLLISTNLLYDQPFNFVKKELASKLVNIVDEVISKVRHYVF